MKILIIGGVAGGASAAARLRRLDEKAEIIIFEKGPYISFANCGLPYFISGTISDRDELLLQTPETFNDRFNVDVRVFNEVMSIDRESKTVQVRQTDAAGHTIREYTEGYDKLILSPGSVPLTPPIPGIEADNIFTLWTVPDVDKIKAFVDREKPRRAAVIGGGFIGLEVAENLVEMGINVVLIESMNQVMAPIDFEMAQIVHRHLDEKGVDVRLESPVCEFRAADGSAETTVVLKDGKTVDTDVVFLSIGVRPQTAIAAAAGLKLNGKGGIVVDTSMRTSDPDIFAVGDAAEIKDFLSGGQIMVPLAGPANRQGRIAAANALGVGAHEVYGGTQGTSIVKIFDLTAASTGINEKCLKAEGKKYGEDYLYTMTHPKSHAGYYPDALTMDMKMIFDPSTRKVLGAQIIGFEGVDKRIDVLATVIRMGGTIDDLTELELAYAPPYSSAKDPVNMAGYIAENMLGGLVDIVNWDQLGDYPGAVLLDVRGQDEEDEVGLIPGSVLLPLPELRSRLDELDREKTYIIYCAAGLRGYIAARMMSQNGFGKVKNLAGGFTTWQPANWKREESSGA